MLDHIQSALQARRVGELDLEKKLGKVQSALEAAVLRTNSTETIVFRDDFMKRLTYGIYDSMNSTHQARNGGESSTLQTQIKTYFNDVTESSAVVRGTARPVSTAEVNNNEVSDTVMIGNGPPQLVSNERERVASLAFSPKCNKDETIEFALLEILSTIGRDSLDELSYDDFVRVVQIVKQEQLATIKVEIHWNPFHAA